jgi:hypothetical protein
MPEEVSSTTIESVKRLNDGMVKIPIEKYDELVEKISAQQLELERSRTRLRDALAEPPVINRTTVIKTDEMVARENRVWGGTFMGMGAAFFIVGAIRYRAGRTAS